MRRSSAINWALIAKMGSKVERRLVLAFCFSFNKDRRHRSYFFWIHLTIRLKICLKYDASKICLKSRNIRKQSPHHFGVDGDIDTKKSQIRFSCKDR